MRLFSSLHSSLTLFATAFASEPTTSAPSTERPFRLVDQFFTPTDSPVSEYVNGNDYWGRAYITAYEDEVSADYYGFQLYEVLQNLDKQEPSGASLPHLLTDFKAAHDDTLQSYIQGWGDEDANTIGRLELYESFRTAVALIRFERMEEAELRQAVAAHLLGNADSSAEEFDFCNVYCMEERAPWIGLSCSANFEAFKVMKALSDIRGDARFSEYMGKIKRHGKNITRNFSFIDSLTVIIDPISAYCQGYGNDTRIFARIDDALEQMAYGEEELEAGL